MSARGAAFALTALVASVVLVGPSGPAGAAPRRQLWDDRLDTSVDAKALVVSPDGTRVFVTGVTSIFTGAIETVAYDASTGARQWDVTNNARSDVPVAIGVSPDGASVFVVGESSHGGDYDFLTIAYDAATGTESWEARYDNGGGDFPKSLVVSSDGARVSVLGSVLGPGVNQGSFAVVSYDATTGTQLWESVIQSTGLGDAPFSLGVSPDGGTLFAAGYNQATATITNFLVVALDATTGQTTWLSRYHDRVLRQDQAFSLAVSSTGAQVFVTGCASDEFGYGACASTPDYLTVAYDAVTGARQWAVLYNGPIDGVDVARAIGVRPSGDLVYVTGYSDQLATTDAVTIAYDASTGSQVWLDAYDGPTNRSDAGCCLAVSADGSRLVVTGSSSGFGSETWSTVGYAAGTGHRVWTASYRGFKYYNYPEGVGVTADGAKAFVAGQITDAVPGSYEWAVVAYQS
jgi:PQQ-like domain